MELHDKMFKLDSWKENISYSMNIVRERQHDMTRLESQTDHIAKGYSKIEREHAKVMERAEQLEKLFERKFTMHDEAFKAVNI